MSVCVKPERPLFVTYLVILKAARLDASRPGSEPAHLRASLLGAVRAGDAFRGGFPPAPQVLGPGQRGARAPPATAGLEPGSLESGHSQTPPRLGLCFNAGKGAPAPSQSRGASHAGPRAVSTCVSRPRSRTTAPRAPRGALLGPGPPAGARRVLRGRRAATWPRGFGGSLGSCPLQPARAPHTGWQCSP